MGVIFQNGLGVGTIPNNTGSSWWNPAYTSNALVVYPNIASYASGAFNGAPTYRSSISDGGPGIYSALGKIGITVGEKKMISFSLDGDDESNPANYWLGIGTTAINLNNNLGNDNNSYGFNNLGDLYYGGGSIETGYPTFGTVGDVIDVAIHGGNLMWYRVNGGAWNGNNAADPSTGTYGIDITGLPTTVYPALSILGFMGPSLFSVFQIAQYDIPSGYSLIAGDNPGVTFTITANQITNPWVVCGSNNGYYDTGIEALVINQAANNVYCGIGATLTNYSQIESVFTNLGIINANTGYICEVTWAAGSTVTQGYAKINYDSAQKRVVINTVDPSDPNSMNNDNNSGSGTQLAGTFKFPATFKVMLPLDQKGGWC